MAETFTPIKGYLPAEAVHVGSIDPRRDLRLGFDELGELHYLDSKLDVFSTEVKERTTRIDIVINHPPLTSADLVGMLGEVAPCKDRPQDKAGILGDWKVIDESKARYKKTEEEKRLVALHTSLGGPWQDFVLSRTVLIDTLTDDKNLGDTSLQNVCLMPAQFEPSRDHEGGFINELVKRRSGSLDGIAETLNDAGFEISNETIASKLRNVLLRCTDVGSVECISSDQGLRDFLAMQAPPTLNYALYQLLREFGLTTEQRTQLAQSAKEKLYGSLRTEDGIEYLYLLDRYTEPLTESYARKHTVTQGPYKKEVITVTSARDGWTEDITIPGAEERVVDHATVSPAISWIRTKGERRLLKRDPTDHRDFFIERYTSPANLFKRVDGLLGVVAVAYLSPDVRSRWPTTMRAGDNSNRHTQEQEMRAAQVPVLARMMGQQLLSGKLVKSAEEITS